MNNIMQKKVYNISSTTQYLRIYLFDIQTTEGSLIIHITIRIIQMGL